MLKYSLPANIEMSISIAKDIPNLIHVLLQKMSDIHLVSLISWECQLQFHIAVFLILFQFLRKR